MLDKELLQSLLNIIHVSSKRGCWEGSELSSVGHVYDRLVAELKEDKNNKEEPI
mgnify:CR=1 FL=1|jgi:hypothetical protein